MTSIEWLWEQIDGIIPYQDIKTSQLFNGVLEQAKEMEKKQIIDAHISGYDSSGESAVDYYDFYYGSKGSDAISSQTISDTCKENLQVEMSDEHIQNEANYLYVIEDEIEAFIKGAKWHREQLKQRQNG